ncbi:MAG: glycosyltransferase, partial [Cyanobacteriota bacterium]
MLSLSMIVRDEEERLERCLRSVAGFVDEMVVVDTGSSDGTVAIAEACGAVVHHLPWPGDFAPARNRALEWVRGDWVLVLDADEWLSPEAREPLQELMADPDALLITLLREERGSRQSPYSSVSRLFRRHPAIRWSRPYHAMVDDSVQELLQREPGWRLLQCGVPALIHDGYRPELLAASTKAARLRAAMEAELRRHPGDPYASAKLGGLELSEGRREKAIALLEQGLRQCAASRQPERYELLLHLAMARSSGDTNLAASLY